MKTHFCIFVCCAFCVLNAIAEPPSFSDTSAPAGWTVVKGEAETGKVLQAKGGAPLELRTAATLPLPVEATFRFRAALGDDLTVQVTGGGTNAAPPLLQAFFRLNGPNYAIVTAHTAGAPMATSTISERTWSLVDKKDGGLHYSWRFPQVRNLWDEADRREIGSDYARLARFEGKVFTLRLTMTEASRQIWLDDRLVAEERAPNTEPVAFVLQPVRTLRVLSAEFRSPGNTSPYLPIPLTAYSHACGAAETVPPCELMYLDHVPMWMPKSRLPDVDLGQSVFRYRRTHGSGPDAGYLNAQVAWPGPFLVDPASLTFRVPYRHYRNAWLLVWLENRPNSVPRGVLQFFRERAGYPARSEFEVTEEAIDRKLVWKLPRKTADGWPLYLVKVPLDTEGLYGLNDLSDQFLDFELTKPVTLMRSYPDPIYYGYHASGWPSSVHVAGITLEEASFGYTAKPEQTEHVFEQPAKPSYLVTVTNTTNRPLSANVTLRTRSYDGREKGGAHGSAMIAPQGAETVKLEVDLKKLGWHGVEVAVEANNQRWENSLSLLVLPPNTRTYGTAPNETRFGTWNLLGHYVPLDPNPASVRNDAVVAMFRQLGLRRISLHESFFSADMLKRHDFLPNGPHTVGGAFADTVQADGSINTPAMTKAVAGEVAAVTTNLTGTSYFYGGEWHIGKEVQYAPWPSYTGDGDRPLNAEEQANALRHVKIFAAIGKAMREQRPDAQLILQWGAPIGTIAYLKAGMPKNLVDLFGMDAPMFELLPELSNVTGSINQLWELRQEAVKLGWARLPIGWCEGPFFPTNPGALTEDTQMDYQIRYWLHGLAYGIEQFQAGVVPHDAGNYYGAEHYGAGIFHRRPLENPKPAAAAVATATAMLCGADVVGPVDTGCLTTYCLAFKRPKEETRIFALWRVNGTVEANLKVRGAKPVVTDAMGNSAECPVRDDTIQVTLSSTPVWLTGVEQIDKFTFDPPRYSEAPARITVDLADMTSERWVFSNAEDKAYAQNHFAIRRIPDPILRADFMPPEDGHPDAVAITLPVEPPDRPLATRYGTLKLKKPVTIPGKASALGIWIKGNSSWGRVIYQLRDAKGEIWTSVGTKDDWNCDDTHAWSYVSFEGWRYVRFPLPSNRPYDGSRDLEMTWWGSHGGDGFVDLPLTLEKMIVEARNEVPYLGMMKKVPVRSYRLAGLVAEYESREDTTRVAIEERRVQKPAPEWAGPTENPIERLAREGVGAAPDIKEFKEPQHFNDGRQMHIRFAQNPALKYNLYLARYPDGRGAELVVAGVGDNQLVGGLRPETKMYLFLTAIGADKKESKPSLAFELVTHDNFLEK
jgi:hypothetical protein